MFLKFYMNNHYIFRLILLLCFFNYNKIKASNIFNYPTQSSVTFDKVLKAEWQNYMLCSGFNFEIATDSQFNNVIFKTKQNENKITYSFPNSGIYYARVKSVCLASWSNIIVNVLDINNEQDKIVNWLAADNNVNIISGRVSKWGDIIDSTNKFFSQNVSANRPIQTNQENFINNKNSIFFRPQNTRSNLIANRRVAINDFSIITLYQFLNYNTSESQFLLGESQNGYYVEYDNPLRGFGVLSRNNANTFEFMFSDKRYVDTIFKIHTVSKNKIFINNNLLPKNGVITDSFRFSNIGFRLDFPDATSFQGRVAEIIIFNKELTDNERDLYHNYLYTKYSPIANLGNDTIVGNSFSDSIILNASNRFVKYLWTTGDTTQIIRIATSGTYGVWATDVFGRKSYDEKKVYPYNRLNNDSIYVCDGGSININLKINENLYNVVWLDNNSNSTNRTFNQEGRYIVEIKDVFNTTIIDTINILFDKFSYNRNITSNLFNGCFKDTLRLLSNTGIDTLHWSNNSTINAYPILENEQVIVYAKSYIGCEYRDTFNINIVGEKPTVDFQIGEVLCEKQTIQLTDASFAPFGNSITNWEWSFSDTTNFTAQNPEKIFQSNGAKSITLKATTNVGCFDEVQKTININKKPRALFDNLLACAGNPIQFRDFSIPNADSIYQWQWNFNNTATSTQKNPTYEFPNATLYHVFLKATNTNNCFDTLTKPIGVNLSPTANFTSDSTACTNSIITFNNTSTAPFPLAITAFNWAFGDGAQDNFLNNTSHIYTTNGTYNVSLAVRANNQCVDTITKKINIYNKPDVDFNISNNKCIGQPIQFTDISTVSDNTAMNSWNWLFGGIGTSAAQNPTFTFNEQGNYTIQLNASTNKGCAATKIKSLTVTQPPLVDFAFSPTNGLPPLNVSFNNLSPVGSTFTWNYGDGSPNFVGYNSPVHTYNTIGNFPIQLSATNFLGCTNTITKYVLVDVANIDAELSALAIVQNEDYYNTILSIKNNSNIPIYNLSLTIRLGNGTLVRETWNGILLPNQTLNYTFVSELRFNDNADIPVICANIESVNFNAVENNISNNSSCKDFKVGNFDILALYPNPAFNILNVGVMVPEAGDLAIDIINYLGQQMIYQPISANKGYNLIPIDISLLDAAHYFIQVKYNNKLASRLFMKK